MEIYISGQITGLKHEEAKHYFQQAEYYLNRRYPQSKIVNPMKWSLPKWASWGLQMIWCAIRLKQCTHIYFIGNSHNSYGARIESLLAMKYGLFTIID